MARGKGLGSYQLKESATPSEATLFRMLQCIPGVSAAKAAAVIEHYHSVSELVEAYESLESEEEKEKMLTEANSATSWVYEYIKVICKGDK